jgi:adenosylmethionine-8-amino-7-oxononanoate aminotransferase
VPALPARLRGLQALPGKRLLPLRDLPGVVHVRVQGAVGAVELAPGRAPNSAAFAARGAFVQPLRLAHADVVYVMLPLVLGGEDDRVLLSAIVDTLTEALVLR